MKTKQKRYQIISFCVDSELEPRLTVEALLKRDPLQFATMIIAPFFDSPEEMKQVGYTHMLAFKRGLERRKRDTGGA